MDQIVMIGAGGHSKVITDIVKSQKNYKIIAVLDDKFTTSCTDQGVYYGPVNDYKIFKANKVIRFIIAIGDNFTRKKVVNKLNLLNERYCSLIHSKAVIGSNVIIGIGSVVMPGAIINADSKIGNHCIINTGSIIEHDNVIESFSHISPRVALAGHVKVNEGAHIGIGVSVTPERNIGAWSVLGAGAVVIKDIPDHCTAVGIPAKPIKFHKTNNRK